MASTPSKTALEAAKLTAETAHLQAQLRKVELETAALNRDDRDHAASANQARVYPFIGGVTPAAVQGCMATLATWSRREPESEMTIVFNSPGGSVIDGLALYDFIDQLKREGHRIVTVGRGMVASMGGVLLQAGSHRVVGYSAHMLIHEVSTGMIGKFSEIEDEVAFCRKLQDRLLDILAERSTLDVKQIRRRWDRKDWWLNAPEAVEYGFADEIG